ncbi:MAG: extracellular solute-binding protein, partial [Anaerolineales bacterium]|nr:extracellular solute-binding protein [Anaerolineales bacterium]
MKKVWLLIALAVAFVFALSACQPQTETQTVEVTRVVTETQEVEVTRVVTETVVETVEGEAVEVTRVVEVPSEPTDKVVVEFWTTDNEEERVNVYEDVAARFMQEHPNVDLRIVPIEEAGVTQRISTALAANRLPDIVRMGVERVAAFSADGILDEDAAEAVIASIGQDDFRESPLAMVTNPETGKHAAVPYDGWLQAIWYRQDVFDQAGLAAPISWDDINAACDALPGTENLLYAVGLGTDPGQNYGHQIFEQVAISNDAWPFDSEGNVTMNTPEMIAALEFYSNLQRCALPGPQYWRGAREAYQYDQAGMFFYSTYIMDDLVDGSGLD